METTVKQRLIKFITYKDISIRQFEKEIGASNGYVNNISKSIGGSKLQRILSAFPDLSQRWLMDGEGPMLIDGQPSQQPPKAPDVPEYLSNAVRSEDVTDLVYAAENKHGGIFYRDQRGQLYMSAPRVPYAAYAQYPNPADSLEPNGEWGRVIYKVDKVAHGCYLSFDIKGDSMDNGNRLSLQDGDSVLARELERDNWRTLRVGDHRFWVLVFGSSVLVKEIIAFNPTTGDITCHSLNPSPEYQDFNLNLDEVRHLYYVIKHQPKQNDM